MRNSDDLFLYSINGGLPRHQVLHALQTPRFVKQAVKVGRCFQCRAQEIDVTGLCLICRSFLNDEERRAAQVYYDGI